MKNDQKVKTTLVVFGIFWLLIILTNHIVHIIPEAVKLFPFSYLLTSTVCHMETEKLLFIADLPTMTCARCTGIYFGAFITSISILFISKTIVAKFRLLIFTSIFMLADVLACNLGIYKYSHPIAFTTGLFFGSVIFLYFYDGLIELIVNKN